MLHPSRPSGVLLLLSMMLGVTFRRLTSTSALTPSTSLWRRNIQHFRSLSQLDASSSDENDHDEVEKRRQAKKRKAQKFKINPNNDPDVAAKLAAAFDELARKEGFGSGVSHFTADSTFDDDFNEDDFDKFMEKQKAKQSSEEDDEFEMDDEFDFDDDEIDFDDDHNFATSDGGWTDDAEDELLDMGLDDDGGSPVQSMEDRIASARRDMDLGRVSVPEELDRFAQDSAPKTLRDLGFKRELDPFQGDSTPRRKPYILESDAMTCPACGSDFQSKDEKRPGYLPPEKFGIQLKLSKIQEMQQLQEKAGSEEWSTDDEIDWLIQTGGRPEDSSLAGDVDIEALAESLNINLDEHLERKVICKRCHGLQNFGTVEEELRPGWSEDPLLAQEKFRHLLKPLAKKNAVIIALVDLFDFAGSVLPELDSVAGENPVIVAANKADLLPQKMGTVRAENWVRRELEYLGVKSLANIGGAVKLVSCKTGMGIQEMLAKAQSLAEERNCSIYLVGAANAGKSTLLNHILAKTEEKWNRSLMFEKPKKFRAGNRNKLKGTVTTSPLPGTTLKFIKVKLDGGRALYDTPGLLVPGSLTQILTPEELKMVVPKKRVEPVTFRLIPGKSVLIGGLAQISLMEDCKPFFFSFFVSNDIKLHVTDEGKAQELRLKHVGGMLTPPLDIERLEQMGEWEHHDVQIEGTGWKEVAADIALTGLGWVGVTGPGVAKVRISVPKGVGVSVRPPLMPFDVKDSTARYTGGRAVRKLSKNSRGKKRGIGRK